MNVIKTGWKIVVYVTREHYIIFLYYYSAVLNLPKKPLKAGNICPSWGRRITWTWEKGTTTCSALEKIQSPVVSTEMKERESRGDRSTPELAGQDSASSWEMCTMSKFQKSPEFPLVIFWVRGKTSLHLLIFRFVHIYYSKQFNCRKRIENKVWCSSLKNKSWIHV